MQNFLFKLKTSKNVMIRGKLEWITISAKIIKDIANFKTITNIAKLSLQTCIADTLRIVYQ